MRPSASGPPPSRSEIGAALSKRYLGDGVPPGTLLPSERSLSQEFGVSRPTIREVLRGLEQQGRITISPGRGVFVRRPGMREAIGHMDGIYRARSATAADLIAARITLERQTAAFAAASATPGDVEAIERALHDFDRASSLVERAQRDIVFHASIARASHNPVLEMMFGSITRLVFELMVRSLGDPTTSGAGIPYHRQILDAIRDGDAERAVAAMDSHITLARSTFGDDLDESLATVADRALRAAYPTAVSLDQVLDDVFPTAEFGDALPVES